jgi:dTDP-4-dehydrorhamnose reductase
MKVLITGAAGQLGRSVRAAALPAWDVVPLDRADLDLTDRGRVDRLAALQPDVIVNCAAYTDVDRAEADERICWAVNAEAPERLAKVAAACGAALIQVSTDYVFDGTASSPYRDDAPVSGLGVYGRSKAAGEQAVREAGGTVVRTAWLYAPGGRNFVSTILRLAAGPGPLRVVDDQIGQPTYAVDVADRIVALIERGSPSGVFHATNSGQTSWYGFAVEIVRLWGLGVTVDPVSSAAFPRPAPRPAYSVLDQQGWSRVGLAPLRPWQEALAAAHASSAAAFM